LIATRPANDADAIGNLIKYCGVPKPYRRIMIADESATLVFVTRID